MPANFAELGVDIHIGAYADAVEAAGGLPVLLPTSDGAFLALDRLDGLVMTGGSDVDPQRYGAEPHPAVYGIDPERDRVDTGLVLGAIRRNLPVLAICRGLQVLNVALGGTLIQHLDPEGGDTHANWEIDVTTLAHDATFTAGSLAEACYGATCAVNSLHHQAADRLGDGLVATGRASDGTVEAIELPGRRLLAVQWHPELAVTHPEASFLWLVTTAGQQQRQ